MGNSSIFCNNCHKTHGKNKKNCITCTNNILCSMNELHQDKTNKRKNHQQTLKKKQKLEEVSIQDVLSSVEDSESEDIVDEDTEPSEIEDEELGIPKQRFCHNCHQNMTKPVANSKLSKSKREIHICKTACTDYEQCKVLKLHPEVKRELAANEKIRKEREMKNLPKSKIENLMSKIEQNATVKIDEIKKRPSDNWFSDKQDYLKDLVKGTCFTVVCPPKTDNVDINSRRVLCNDDLVSENGPSTTTTTTVSTDTSNLVSSAKCNFNFDCPSISVDDAMLLSKEDIESELVKHQNCISILQEALAMKLKFSQDFEAIKNKTSFVSGLIKEFISRGFTDITKMKESDIKSLLDELSTTSTTTSTT